MLSFQLTQGALLIGGFKLIAKKNNTKNTEWMVFENPPEGIEFRESVSPVIGSSDSFDNFSVIPASSNEFFKVSPSIFSLAKSSSISDRSKPVLSLINI